MRETQNSYSMKGSNDGIDQSRCSAHICSVSGAEERKNKKHLTRSFLDALENLFKQAERSSSDRHFGNLSPYFYTDIRPRGYSLSGALCAERLISGVFDRSYTIPESEMHFLVDNEQILKDYFAANFAKLKIDLGSLGCGPGASIVNKDFTIASALQPYSYTAVDINFRQSVEAASIISSRMPNVKTKHIAQDFTKRLPLRSGSKDSITFLTLLGDTIAQYACTDVEASSRNTISPMQALLENFAESTNHRAVMLVTFDVVTKPSETLRKYQGDGMIELINTFWATVKEVTGDRKFEPCALTYQPEFDESSSTVDFLCRAKKPTSITIKGKNYEIRKHDEFVIGCSQKIPPEKAIPICQRAGWKVEELPFKNIRSTTTSTRALMLAGNKIGT